MLSLIFQFRHKRIGKIRPNLAEGSIQDIAETLVSPELVGVNGTVPADASDTPPGTVPFIHLEEFQDLPCLWVLLLQHPLVEIGAVRMVVNGQDLFRHAPFMEVLCPIHD